MSQHSPRHAWARGAARAEAFPSAGTGAGPARHARQHRSATRRRAVPAVIAALVVLATAGAGTASALAKTVTVSVDGSARHITTMSGTVVGALASAGITLSPHDSLAPGADTRIADGSAIVLDRGRRVTLDLDGQSRTLWSTGPTVGDALAHNGIAVGPHDTLAPAQATALTGGQRIVIQRGRPFTLTVDGTEHQVWTTARTVEAALARLGRPAADYELSADRSRPIPLSGLSVSATRMHTVTLTNGVAQPTTFTTAASTVGDLLADRGITFGARDTVSPSADTDLTDGLAVVVVGHTVTTMAYTEKIPQPADRTISDNMLEKGKRHVTVKGHPGVALVTSTVTLTNGAVTATANTTRTVVTPAVTAVIHVGIAPKLQWVGNEVYTHDRTYGVNWDGLAMCESTHNPRAINAHPSAGLPTYGLFQFDLPTWRSVGGHGNPIDADPAEQLMRAKMLYQKRGLGPWACAYAAH